jgi:4,5-DOPA dioxygenase extradiol
MAAAFVGHGSPMNAIEDNRFTKTWATLGASLPRPRAILVISAHWYIHRTAVTSMVNPRTVHDFGGFPQQLFDVRYPVPGDPELAGEIVELLKPTTVELDSNGWGLDHGAWSVLVHAFPRADVPVLQLSINAEQPFDWHFALGAKLAPLRKRNVLMLGSGNVVHNLRAMDASKPDVGLDWARRFDSDVRAILTSRPADIVAIRRHPDFQRAQPTPDHFMPVLYIAGLADAEDRPLEVLADGFSYGAISMTCYGLDVPNLGVA